MPSPLLAPYFTDIKFIKGIGPILSKKIVRLVGGERAFDLLCHKPYATIDRTYMPRITEAEDKRIASFRVRIEKYEEPPYRTKLPFRVICRNTSGFLQLIFFQTKREIIHAALPLGEERIISGKVEHYGEIVQIMHPERIAKIENASSVIRHEPQYFLTAGVTQKKLLSTVELVLQKLTELPEWQLDAKISFKDALVKLHNPIPATAHPALDAGSRPKDPASSAGCELGVDEALERLVYDELLASQIAQGLVYNNITKKPGAKVLPDSKLYQKVLAKLPFNLTSEQQKAIDQILIDMSSGERMFRLLQGDVGSGKTVVGLLAMLAVIDSGKQAAYMAPTTLLSNQQRDWFDKITGEFGVKVELLTGAEKGKKREDILARLKAGEIDILVGTHAIFQDWVEFKNLGIVIIDEQHRFGVLQRLKLSQKNERAHILLMTATPIPRSLTIAFYGEMAISRITEKPAERLPIETLVTPIPPSFLPPFKGGDLEGGKITTSIRRAISKGEKIYWICPLVEESEKSDSAAATERYQYFQKLFGAKVGLIHGRMKEKEKSENLLKFLHGEYQLLVATTVIEVGIDVRDASVIFIEHAERFGLSQLHQLRGRVGRGNKKSTCILLYAGRLSAESGERLKVMKQSNDGFFIAEEDLRIRGAGDVLGTKQSGFSEFKFALIPQHQDLLLKARDEAREIISHDPKFTGERGQNLKLLLSLFEYDETINYISAG